MLYILSRRGPRKEMAMAKYLLDVHYSPERKAGREPNKEFEFEVNSDDEARAIKLILEKFLGSVGAAPDGVLSVGKIFQREIRVVES